MNPLAWLVTLVVGLSGTVDTANTALHRAPRVVEVQMLDKGGGQWRFEPAEIVASYGDVIRFVQGDIVPHNVQFKEIPPGTDLEGALMGPFLLQKGDVYEVAIDDRFAPGIHEFVCTPHEMMGMVGSIDVRPGT